MSKQMTPSSAGEGKKPLSPLLALFFAPTALLYHELLLRAFDRSTPFFSISLLYIFLFANAAGLTAGLVLSWMPRRRKLTTAIAYTLCTLWTVLTCVEYCCKSYFKTYFGLGFMATMTGGIVGDFFGTMVEVVLARLPFILLSLIPLLTLIIFPRQFLPWGGQWHVVSKALVVLIILSQLAGSLLCNYGANKTDYTYNYTTDSAVPKFGLVTTLRLELQHSLFGTPDAPITDLSELDGDASAADDNYGYNKLDLDFSALAETADNPAVASLHEQFRVMNASQKNEYTGLFAGKNLIEITAEAFCPYVISQELTPTLYQLTHSGFVFTDYYQPGWGQSTTGGEFAVMTGLIPTWIHNNLSFYVSHVDYMPFALGNQLKALGYDTVAYHNNSYTYYDRNLTHPNLGYDFYGVGNGLAMTGGDNWPYSDLEMMQLTVPGLLEDSAQSGQLFHAYYMTVSGHANWGWGNAMSAKHQAEAMAAYPDASQPVQGYIAANLELEAAMTYLLEQLEQAGVADDTVIVLTADHYPYALVTEDVDYYQELSGTMDSEQNISRYRNTLILWSGSMDEAVTVDTPCSSIDILPTLSNLFGLSYDSRLLSGHDVLATNYTVSRVSSSMPLVILPTTGGNSWITCAGVYDASTGMFTPKQGVSVGSNYVEQVETLIEAKYSYAKAIIQYDYYAAVFGRDTNAMVFSPASASATDIESTEAADTAAMPAE